jgi:hypothetical protein
VYHHIITYTSVLSHNQSYPSFCYISQQCFHPSITKAAVGVLSDNDLYFSFCHITSLILVSAIFPSNASIPAWPKLPLVCCHIMTSQQCFQSLSFHAVVSSSHSTSQDDFKVTLVFYHLTTVILVSVVLLELFSFHCLVSVSHSIFIHD